MSKLSTLIVSGLLMLCASVSTRASNELVTIDFAATNFHFGVAPIDAVQGSFSFIFDPTQNYLDWTPGVTINSLNVSSFNGSSSQASFSAVYDTSVPQLGSMAVKAFDSNTGSYAEFYLSSGNIPLYVSSSGSIGGSVFPGVLISFDYGSGHSDSPIYGQYVAGSGTYSITVASVPEAETYAMLLAGVGFIGFLVRRRKSV